ncbi:MAG: hypothetical protein ACO1O1_14460 [Adhaeribacter sp.]
MKLTQEEFDDKLQQGLDAILLALAEEQEVNPEKFFSLACVVENLAFFSPVLYGMLRKPEE